MTGGTIRKRLPVLVLILAAAAPLESHAADVRPIIKVGYEFGGDTLVSVPVAGSGGTSTESIKSNEGFSAGLGTSILMDSKVLEVEVSLSYKFSKFTAQDADIDWTVLPLDALVFYRLPNFRLGGGLTYHLRPTLKGSGVLSDLSAKYDDALGFVLQADYVFDKRFTLGLRYTSVDYKAKSQQNSSLGVTPETNPRTSAFGVVFTMVSF